MFVLVFAVALLATLAFQDLPPGKQIYSGLNLPTTDYQVLGVSATTLINAVFNGLVYDIVVWLIYTLAEHAAPKTQEQKKNT